MAIQHVIRGNASGAVKGIRDLNKELNKTEEELEAAVKAGKELRGAARRIAESADPQRKYNRQLAELADLVKKGKVEFSAAEREAARLGMRLNNVGKGGANTMNALVGKLTAVAGGYLSVTSLVGKLTAAFQEQEQVAQAAADATFAAISSQGELQQLSADKVGELNEFAKDLIRRGIFSPEQRSQAFQTSFNLESAGFTTSEKNFLADVGQSRFVGAEGLLEFGGRLQKAKNIFGEEDTGSLEQLLDKVVTGAAVTQSDASTIAGKIPDFAGEAKALGFQFEEALAAFVEIEKVSANPDIAATRFKSFLTRLDKAGLAVNGSIAETIDALQAQIDSGTAENKLVPDARGLPALRRLLEARRSGSLGVLQSEIDESEGAFRSKVGGLERVDSQFGLALGRAEQEGILDQSASRQRIIEDELAFDIARAAIRQASEETGGPTIAALQDTLLSLVDALGGERGVVQDVLERPAEFDGLSEANRARLLEYLERTATASERSVGILEKSRINQQTRQE